MAETINMPKWGLTMEEGSIAEWKVVEDQPVAKGDLLCLVETEKVTMEMQSPIAGVVARILVATGETVPVGEPVIVIAGNAAEAGAVRQSGENR